jgi:superfamily I DNA/RNA helicase
LTFIEVLAEHNLCTFDDQIVFALAILHTNPEILHEYQRYFEHIIIDELQDFSPAKVELLMLLCEKHDNIMAFGDIFQEVLFDKLQGNSENVKVSAETVFSRLTQRDTCNPGNAHQLMVNFRSTQEILDLATFIRSKAIATNRNVSPLQSWQNNHGAKPTYLYTDTESIAEMLEATLDRIGQLSASEQESVALIFGGKEMLRHAQTILTQRTIPFSLMDGQKMQYQLHYVKNILLYLFLIEDKTRDDDTERLLRYNIVPYIDKTQLLMLRRLASREGICLFVALASAKQLRAASISKEQEESLRHHLALIEQSKLDTSMSQFEQALRELSDGPLTLLQEQAEKLKEAESILANFRTLKIQDALAEIRRHITFLDKHQGRTDLVLSTVDYAKSQEFETVFLLGLRKVFGKRLYVSVSRAKQRLFFVGDEEAFAKNRTLSEIPRRLYTTANCTRALPS